ncbi:MAG: DUF1338 domain-containing protein [Bdellovibrionales bacterium]
MSLEVLFEKMWDQYSELNPQAQEIHNLLEKTGGKISNDHVAYRSVNLPGFGVDTLKAPLLAKGYKICGEYRFEQKKLYAIHLEHEDKSLPKVFISELLLEELSPRAQELYKETLKGAVLPEGEAVLTSGRTWPVDYKVYEELYKESEYAAWLLAFGYCANHFTINVNELSDFSDLVELNAFLEKNGYKLNESGGKIKGSKEVFLEQSSTMAGELGVSFADGEKKVPSCYYEFALRHKMENGELYQGFVAGSADKIFESTNKL